MVHEEALLALQKRAHEGDVEAGSVLTDILSHCGRREPVPDHSDIEPNFSAKDGVSTAPLIETYPSERLIEFRQAVREAGLYGDDHLANWTVYWSSKEPDNLLDVLMSHRLTHVYPLETQSAKVVVDLVFERQGRAAAWDWLVAYHKGVYGWTSYAYGLKNVEWIWDRVRTRFNNRWLEFIIESSDRGETPNWGIERMVRFLRILGKEDQVDEVLEAAVRWGAALVADMRLPDQALTPDQPELPTALWLLVDRLDCPSRMVQERAAWSLAVLLANADTRNSTAVALQHWRTAERLEMRSCMFLLILHLARTAHGLTADICAKYASEADLVPSIGADLMLREFGVDGEAIAVSLDYQDNHSGWPSTDFSGVKEFPQIVSAYLAPIFNRWARNLDKSGIAFSRQWGMGGTSPIEGSRSIPATERALCTSLSRWRQ